MEPSSPPTNIKALNQNGNLNNRGTYQQVLLNNTGSPKPSTPQSHSKQSNKQQNKQSSSTPLGSVAGMKYSPPSSSGRKVSPILPNSNDPPNSPPPPPIIVVGEEDLNLSSCSDNEIVNPALVQNLHNGIQASDSSSTTSNNEEEISFTSPLCKFFFHSSDRSLRIIVTLRFAANDTLHIAIRRFIHQTWVIPTIKLLLTTLQTSKHNQLLIFVDNQDCPAFKMVISSRRDSVIFKAS